MDISQLDLLLWIAVEVVYILIILLAKRKDNEEDIAAAAVRVVREILKIR